MFSNSNFISKILSSLMYALFVSIILIGCLYLYMIIYLPNVNYLNHISFQEPVHIYSKDHQLIGEFGEKRRLPMDYQSIPKYLIKAIIATEDQRFFQHAGVDFIGLVRAAKLLIITGKKKQGASTITMQVARNFFLSSRKTFARKINEILLAIKIDQKLSKEKILELYMNKIFLGYRAYGVAAAAQVYYGKSLQSLNLAQLATIAGLPQAPSRNNPIKNPLAAKKRRDHVLYRMYTQHYISQKEFQHAIEQPITASYHQPLKPAVHAPEFAEMVRQWLIHHYGLHAYEKGWKVYTTLVASQQKHAEKALKKELIAYSKRHGYKESHQNLLKMALIDKKDWQALLQKNRLDSPLEKAAVTAITPSYIRVLRYDGSEKNIDLSSISWAMPKKNSHQTLAYHTSLSIPINLGDIITIEFKKNHWTLSQTPTIQGALVALNPKDSAILALVGGSGYGNNDFNRATQAWRQPGSAFKPFLYAAALESKDKNYTLATTINDAPLVEKDFGENTLWRPQNHSHNFYGPTRLRVALVKSRNLIAVRLLKDIGIKYTRDYITRFGFDLNKQPPSLSLALGAGSVTPLQLASAYASIANGGYHVAPYFIDHIINAKGKCIYTKKASPLPSNAWNHPPDNPSFYLGNYLSDFFNNQNKKNKKSMISTKKMVLSPQTAYLLNDVLKTVITNGTGRQAKILHRKDLAGKTGTTNQKVDAWFAGYNPDIVATVWVGFDNNKSTHEYGSQVALPIWIDFMRQALMGKSEKQLPIPPGIVTVRINPKTGLASQFNTEKSIFELFRKERIPPQTTAKPAEEENDELMLF